MRLPVLLDVIDVLSNFFAGLPSTVKLRQQIYFSWRNALPNGNHSLIRNSRYNPLYPNRGITLRSEIPFP